MHKTVSGYFIEIIEKSKIKRLKKLQKEKKRRKPCLPLGFSLFG